MPISFQFNWLGIMRSFVFNIKNELTEFQGFEHFSYLPDFEGQMFHYLEKRSFQHIAFVP